MIDLRELLKKYIERVQMDIFHSASYDDRMNHEWWRDISREEWELLNELRNEAGYE
jgi:hypothetical protein